MGWGGGGGGGGGGGDVGEFTVWDVYKKQGPEQHSRIKHADTSTCMFVVCTH